jgi:hypothetical protein
MLSHSKSGHLWLSGCFETALTPTPSPSGRGSASEAGEEESTDGRRPEEEAETASRWFALAPAIEGLCLNVIPAGCADRLLGRQGAQQAPVPVSYTGR